MSDNTRIVERLKVMRKHLGLSQREIAEKVGCSKGAWEGYERGQNLPGGAILQSVAALGINVHWLLTGEGVMVQTEEPTMGEFDEELFKDIVIEQEEYIKGIKCSAQERADLYFGTYRSVMKDRKRRAEHEGLGTPALNDADFEEVRAVARHHNPKK